MSILSGKRDFSILGAWIITIFLVKQKEVIFQLVVKFQILKPSNNSKYSPTASSISFNMIYSSAVCEREERPGPIFTDGKDINA
jgi:hypothetical protein